MTVKPTRVLTTACGGATGMDVARCLKRSTLPLEVIGMDALKEGRMFGQKICDRVIVAPPAGKDFISSVEKICESFKIDAVIFNHSKELKAICETDSGFNLPCLLPKIETIKKCSNKWLTATAFSGPEYDKFIPITCLIPRYINERSAESEMNECFNQIGNPLWLRLAEGSGGKGALLVNNLRQATNWMEYWKEMFDEKGQWIIQEYLPGRNYNWISLWINGGMIASSLMERSGYLMARSSISGVSGQISSARIIKNQAIERFCLEAIDILVSGKNHIGIFSIDLKEDDEGKPKITEIECRFTGRPLLHAMAGLNLPEMAVRLLAHLPLDYTQKIRGSLEGLTIYRQIDSEPIFTVVPETKTTDDEETWLAENTEFPHPETTPKE